MVKKGKRKSRNKKIEQKNKRNQHFLFFAIAIILSVVLYFAMPDQASRFKASLMDLQTPFDGAVLPVKQVPNWVAMTPAERKMDFKSIPKSKLIASPKYNPSLFTIKLASLGATASDNVKKNTLITYSVPFLGSYKIAAGLGEGAGSHPAVDIKLPIGTPIYSIANGVVWKVAESSGGFGKHIVVMHPNAPSYKNKKITEDIYSNYCHLSQIIVKKDQVVKKGDLIGYSGDSGTSTTPHLHFQIDRNTAPFHPYWPFKSSEAKAKGLDFFTAINAGLGIQNVKSNNINPLMYIQKYANTTTTMAKIDTSDNTKKKEEVKKEEVVKEEEVKKEEVKKEEVVKKEEIKKEEKVETQSEKNQDFFKDVSENHKNFEAIKCLKKKNIISGDKGKNTYRPDDNLSRVECLVILIKSFDIKLEESGKNNFPDVKKGIWYEKAVITAVKNEIAQGNPNGNFEPNKNINRAAFFAMLMSSANISFEKKPKVDPFVGGDPVWYGVFAEFAKSKKLLDFDGKFDANKNMTRGDIVEAIFRVKGGNCSF